MKKNFVELGRLEYLEKSLLDVLDSFKNNRYIEVITREKEASFERDIYEMLDNVKKLNVVILEEKDKYKGKRREDHLNRFLHKVEKLEDDFMKLKKSYGIFFMD